MLSPILLLAAILYDTSTIKVSVSPSPVFVERMGNRQSVNCDLIIENPTSAPVDLDEVQASVYDRSGQLVIRRFIDGNGTRPSIRTADVAEVPPASQVLVFNPFHTFDSDLDLDSIVFELKLSTRDGSVRYLAFPGESPQVVFVVSGTQTAVEIRLRLKASH